MKKKNCSASLELILFVTELEYDYAVAKGKPTFAVVIKEAALEQKVKNGGTAFIEKENPKALSVFREEVLKNISSFFSDPKDVILCVYESMSDYAANLKGWVAGGDVAEVKSMQEELRLLRDDNQELRRKLASTEAQTSQGNKAKFDEELLDVLRAIKVKIPANLAGGKEVTLDLFSMVHGNRDTLITGV